MERNRDGYVSPLSTRYASREMQYLFSDNNKFRTCGGCGSPWAEAERELGPAHHRGTDRRAEGPRRGRQLRRGGGPGAGGPPRRDEPRLRLRPAVPQAEGIIHLGATSCYVGDNTDLIILRDASRLVLKKAAQVLRNLADFARRYKDLPCLGYTHLQPAQLTTVASGPRCG